MFCPYCHFAVLFTTPVVGAVQQVYQTVGISDADLTSPGLATHCAVRPGGVLFISSLHSYGLSPRHSLQLGQVSQTWHLLAWLHIVQLGQEMFSQYCRCCNNGGWNITTGYKACLKGYKYTLPVSAIYAAQCPIARSYWLFDSPVHFLNVINQYIFLYNHTGLWRSYTAMFVRQRLKSSKQTNCP